MSNDGGEYDCFGDDQYHQCDQGERDGDKHDQDGRDDENGDCRREAG